MFIDLCLFFAEGSSEEHRYVGRLTREKRAFESLITTKADMVISLPDHADDLTRERNADKDLSMDTRTRHLGVSSASSYASSTASSSVGMRSVGMNLGKGGRTSFDVVVDVREFRSALPSLLHQQGFHLIPRTLQVRGSTVCTVCTVMVMAAMDLLPLIMTNACVL